MKRKILAIVCVSLFLVGCLCSCKGKKEEEKVEKPDTSISEIEKEEEREEEKEEKREDGKISFEEEDIPGLGGSKMPTLGELESAGFVYQGYIGSNGRYLFTYIDEMCKYSIEVDMPADVKSAMDEISILDDDYKEKSAALRKTLIAESITITSGEVISEEELAKYVGQPASSLVDDGFESTGYMGDGAEYVFFFAKDGQEYSVTLDDSAAMVMNAIDEYEEEILSCFVESIKYKNPY